MADKRGEIDEVTVTRTLPLDPKEGLPVCENVLSRDDDCVQLPSEALVEGVTEGRGGEGECVSLKLPPFIPIEGLSPEEAVAKPHTVLEGCAEREGESVPIDELETKKEGTGVFEENREVVGVIVGVHVKEEGLDEEGVFESETREVKVPIAEFVIVWRLLGLNGSVGDTKGVRVVKKLPAGDELATVDGVLWEVCEKVKLEEAVMNAVNEAELVMLP